jgi:hypothetical protein
MLGADSTARGEHLLGTSDLQSLADLSTSVDIVRNMRIAPASLRLLTDLAIAASLPMLPLLLFKYLLAGLIGKFLYKVDRPMTGEGASADRRGPFYVLLIVLLLASPTLLAQQTTDNLRELARNPLGDVVKVPFVESINFDAGRYDRISNSLQIQPIIPLQIAKNWLLVPRIVATPVAYLPDVTTASGGSTGLGDTVATFFLTPAHTGKVIWGVGPSLLIPTATDANIGAGKWGLGPSVAALVEPNWGSAGVVVQNIWSLPGNSQRPSVNQLQIEASFSYNLPHDWYLVTAPTINADWTQSSEDRWLVPFGGGIGRAFDIANQAVDLNIAFYFNPIRPTRQFSPTWQMSLQFTLLYPRKRKPTSD